MNFEGGNRSNAIFYENHTSAKITHSPFLHITTPLTVKDISKNNTVVRIGTVMWKFTATNGDILYLPGLAYHLPTADIRLLSPQAYHQMYGGESRVDGNNVLMSLPPKRRSNQRLHSINIQIEKGISNLPIVHKVSCTDDEREQFGPHL